MFSETLPEWIIAFTAVSALLIAWRQLLQQVEERFNVEYRQLSMSLPIEALLGNDHHPSADELKSFFRYFDLSNEEVFLIQRHFRLPHHAKQEWKDGIKYNMGLPAFQNAWDQILSLISERHSDSPPFEYLRNQLIEWKSLPSTGRYETKH